MLRRTGTPDDPLPGSWLSYGRDQRETRYSTLAQINPGNVKELGLAWSYVMGAGGGNQEGTPLVWNETLYGITTWSVVFALDARTGMERWRWDPQVDQPASAPPSAVATSTAAWRSTRTPSSRRRLTAAFALDARTGRLVWDTRVVDYRAEFTLTMAPRIAGDTVIIGAAGGDNESAARIAVLFLP